MIFEKKSFEILRIINYDGSGFFSIIFMPETENFKLQIYFENKF